MANGDKYKELRKQLEKETTSEGKLDILCVMVCMMATNDLDHIYRILKKIVTALVAIGIILIIAFPNIVKSVIDLIGKVF